MKIITNECVGCPTDFPCIYYACPYYQVERFYCDKCGEETTLYDTEFGQLCSDCLLKEFPIVEGSEDYI